MFKQGKCVFHQKKYNDLYYALPLSGTFEINKNGAVKGEGVVIYPCQSRLLRLLELGHFLKLVLFYIADILPLKIVQYKSSNTSISLAPIFWTKLLLTKTLVLVKFTRM